MKGQFTEREENILLVEDSPGDANLFREALKEGDWHPNLYIIETAEEALIFLHRKGKHTRATRPNLILLDLKLPQMSGLEFLARLKKDPKLRSIPVVVMTASKSARDVRRALDLHANSYILKPLFWRDYVAAIKTIEDFWFGRAESSPK